MKMYKWKSEMLIAIISLVSLAGFNQKSFACGESGDVEARIADCNTIKRASNGAEFALVSKQNLANGKDYEYWQDNSQNGNKIIWGHVHFKKLNQKQATKHCESLNDLGIKWELPTREEYLKAADNSVDEQARPYAGYNLVIQNFLSEMPSRWFWTRTLHPKYENALAWFFDGNNGLIHNEFLFMELYVRCKSK